MNEEAASGSARPVGSPLPLHLKVLLFPLKFVFALLRIIVYLPVFALPMLRARRPLKTFSNEAQARWNEIPEAMQDRILASVFCARCLKGVPCDLTGARMDDEDLILEGHCGACGYGVRRLVEPDGD